MSLQSEKNARAMAFFERQKAEQQFKLKQMIPISDNTSEMDSMFQMY